jgi:hypothetical protein
MNFRDPVYCAINTLCELQKVASYAEIASVAGIKKQLAINYILRNKHLLKINAKGKIEGFISHESNVRRIVDAMFTRGEVYKVKEINYGADKAIEVHPNYYEKVKHLEEAYWEGGFGDSYKAYHIIVRDNIKEKMLDLGFRFYNDVVEGKISAGSHNIWVDWCVP